MNSNASVSLSFDSIKKAINAFLHRFHIIIFVVVVLGGLAIVILLLNNIIVTSSQSNGYTPNTNNGTFDQATIKKVENLQTSGQSNQLVLPSGRTNPFVE